VYLVADVAGWENMEVAEDKRHKPSNSDAGKIVQSGVWVGEVMEE
jgi:hypothetical protein